MANYNAKIFYQVIKVFTPFEKTLSPQELKLP